MDEKDLSNENLLDPAYLASLAEAWQHYAIAINTLAKAMADWYWTWLDSLSPGVRAMLFSAKSEDDILRVLKKARRRERYLRKYERRGRRMK